MLNFGFHPTTKLTTLLLHILTTTSTPKQGGEEDKEEEGARGDKEDEPHQNRPSPASQVQCRFTPAAADADTTRRTRHTRVDTKGRTARGTRSQQPCVAPQQAAQDIQLQLSAFLPPQLVGAAPNTMSRSPSPSPPPPSIMVDGDEEPGYGPAVQVRLVCLHVFTGRGTGF